MINTKALIALFAVLLKVQADVVTVTANTVAVVTATAVASAVATELKTVSPHPKARHEAREEIREERRENNYCPAPAKVHHHRKHKACGVVDHPRAARKACDADVVDHPKAAVHHHRKHKHHKAARHHKACGVVDHPRVAKEVVDHPKAAAHHHAKKVHHAKAHHAIDKMKKGCPLAAHLAAKGQILPGKEHKDHDSNDFASFEVAQLDILRVTKLDSEHKHDNSVKIVDEDVKASIARRADKRQDARQLRMAARADRIDDRNDVLPDPVDDVQDRRQARRRLHHRANNDIGPLSDSDNDVRAHVRVNRAVNRGPIDVAHPRAHAMNDEVGIDADIDHPRARARAHVRVGNDEIGPDADIDHPRARARAHAHVRVNNNEIGPDADIDHPRARARANVRANNDKPGFFDRLRAPAKVKAEAGPVDNNVHPRARAHAHAKAAGPDNKDLKITAKDRKHLIADLKAIDALDREALQYLDTSCGAVKALDSKKAKRAAKHAARHAARHHHRN